MTRKEVLKRVDAKITRMERILEARTEPTWSGVVVWGWKDDLDFFKSIRSFIEEKK